MKKLLIFALLLASTGVAVANEEVWIDGIKYNLTTQPYGDTGMFRAGPATLTTSGFPNGDEYKGELTIPEQIEYNGTKYVITTVNRAAFYMQELLTAVNLPQTVVSIDTQAFAESGITSMTLPENVNSIGLYPFRKCNSLTELIVLAPTPPKTESSSFDATIYSKVKLFVPKGCVTAYQKDATWKNFTSIEEYAGSPIRPTGITLSKDHATGLVDWAFTLTANIEPSDATDKTVEWKSLNPEVATVDENGYVRCIAQGRANIEAISNGNRQLSAMCVLTVMDSIATIDGLKYSLEYDEDAQIARATVIAADTPYSGAITIPPTIQHLSTFGVTGIGPKAFAGCNISTLSLPYSIDTIATDAFSGTTGLTRVDVSSLGAWKRIHFANGAANPAAVADSLLIGGKLLTEVTFASGETAVNPYSFFGVKNLSKVELASTVKSIGAGAFAGTSLLMVEIPQAVEKIEEETFANCSQLVSVALPDNLKTIGVKAFYNSPRIRFIRCVNTTPPTFESFVGDPTTYGEAFSTEIWPDCTLQIPQNMFGNYKQYDGWKLFRTWNYWHPNDHMASELTLQPTTFAGREGSSFELTAALTPAAPAYTEVVLINSNPGIIALNDENSPLCLLGNGLTVKLLKEGTAEIRAINAFIQTTMTVTVDNSLHGVETIDSESDSEPRWFNLQGIELTQPEDGQIVIEMRGSKATKRVYRR